MFDQLSHDRTIAKLQHFSDLLKQSKIDSESLLLTIDHDCCEKEKIVNQILLYDEILKEYHVIFEDILYR
jgi:hypothetical protein